MSKEKYAGVEEIGETLRMGTSRCINTSNVTRISLQEGMSRVKGTMTISHNLQFPKRIMRM
jgi:hypothetical protein